MTTHYNPLLVFASLVISILACWTALELSCRVHAQRSHRARAFWLGSGAFVMGLGIWAMHYVGMLAAHSDVPVSYYLPTVVLSFFAAVLASAVALYLVSKPTLSRLSMVTGGLVMGGGIASMHYIGMAAMRMPFAITYSAPLVTLSLVLAVVISMVALHLCFATKQDATSWSGKKIGSALLMGIAVPSMHYVGMAAVRMPAMANGPFPVVIDPLALPVSQLGIAAIIGVVTICICFALLAASFNRDALAVQSKLDQTKNENELLSEYQQRLIKAYRQNGVGAWEWIAATDSFSIDPGIRTIYDPTAINNQQIPRADFLALLHPEDLPHTQERWLAALASGSQYENEYRIRQQDGTVRRCRSVATITRNPDGTPASVLGMSWDVTDEHAQQQEHAEQARRFYLTLEAIGDAVLSVDAAQNITYANPMACELTGWSKQECLGKPFAEVFVAQDEATGVIRRSAVQRCIELGGRLLNEDGILLSKTGARYNIQKHVNLVDDHGSAVVTFQDITAARLLKRELEIAATHDSLTGLPNRVAFERRLQHVWTHERDGSRQHCLALIDLDRFKLVNDTAGHLAGDALLQRVVHTVQPVLRPGDCLARMGGDEFLLLLRDVTLDEAQSLSRALLERVEALHFVWHHRTYPVTASLGMVLFDRASPSLDALTSHADVALFTSKRNGRNRLALYESSIGEAAGNLQEMEAVSEIRAALEQDRFELHAQPIVPLGTPGTEPYFELLLRMRDSRGGLVVPAHFIPAAECYGMMQLLDRWVIRKTLAMYPTPGNPRLTIRFAVNLSADSLSDPTLWNFVYEQFQLTGVPPQAITFEVTESGLIRNMATARAFLTQAQATGCRIALDDFGTGMSSLSYLKQFPLDVIKIDGAFVRKLLSTPLDQSIVQAISQIAHSMGADTVAECAEDMETVDLLSSLSVDYVQGWATGKPQPLTQVLHSLTPTPQRSQSRTFSAMHKVLANLLPRNPEPQTT